MRSICDKSCSIAVLLDRDDFGQELVGDASHSLVNVLMKMMK